MVELLDEALLLLDAGVHDPAARLCVPGPEVDGDAVDEGVRPVLPDEVERLPVLAEDRVLTLQDLPPGGAKGISNNYCACKSSRIHYLRKSFL